MLKIYYTAEAILKEQYQDYSKGFKEGFATCLKFFWIGLNKREDFNLRIRVHELEIENHELKKIVEKKYQKVKALEADLGTKSLISGNPMELFREVLIETESVGNFSVVVNMDEDTTNLCILNFATRNVFKTADECKSKLMQFINNKKNLGFRAFKDKSVAVREGAKML